MKTVQLFHNPGAGDGEHSKKELIKLVEAQGFECQYTSVKEKGWKDEVNDDADILAIAGGDGTVRKLVKALVKRTLLDSRFCLGLLPMGTANNISKTINHDAGPEEVIAAWKQCNIRRYDMGRVTGLEEPLFFLESFGFGVFPNLMKDMKKQETDDMEPEDKLHLALEEMKKIVEEYEARDCKLTIDGIDHSGKFLMIEVMNTRSIGPNLELNPNADIGDGELEVVLVGEDHRQQLINYIAGKLDGNPSQHFSTLKAKKIELSWDGVHAHVDDEIVKKEKSEAITIKVLNGALEFLVPTEQN